MQHENLFYTDLIQTSGLTDSDAEMTQKTTSETDNKQTKTV